MKSVLIWLPDLRSPSTGQRNVTNPWLGHDLSGCLIVKVVFLYLATFSSFQYSKIQIWFSFQAQTWTISYEERQANHQYNTSNSRHIFLFKIDAFIRRTINKIFAPCPARTEENRIMTSGYFLPRQIFISRNFITSSIPYIKKISPARPALITQDVVLTSF